MADKTNWIIGQGESLVQKVKIGSGGGEKAYPYEFDEAVQRLKGQIDDTVEHVNELPRLACPGDEAVVALTLHPSFLAKTYHPSNLLKSLGLRQVGSRERKIIPGALATHRVPDRPLVAPELFVAGRRENIARLAPSSGWLIEPRIQNDFRKIEEVRALGMERVKLSTSKDIESPVEIVLHTGFEDDSLSFDVVENFQQWCDSIGPNLPIMHLQKVSGLAFIGMTAQMKQIERMAQFSFMRLARRMPRLAMRDLEMPYQSLVGSDIDIPYDAALSTNVRLAIFDGGLDEDHPFGELVVSRDAPGVGAATTAAIEHGTCVTSAALFGPIVNGQELPQPFSEVEHWRVVDDQRDDFELMTTLDRVMEVLSQNKYDVVNLSLGPDEAMLDDDVHIWTSRLDQYAANGQTLIVTAVGNNGEEDEALGLNRVQPASDGVNILAVGARDRLDAGWSRAPYSAIGPGRSPGLVKPDVVAFGGSENELFVAVNPNGVAHGAFGTSYSAPSVARIAAALGSTFASQLTPVAIKALIVHNAEDGGNHQEDVGWGSTPTDITELMTCDDDEATVVFQGFLEPSRHMRFPLPVPVGGFASRVTVRGTFVVATPIDPEDAINYTRTGVGITFRPSTIGHPGFHPNGSERHTHPSRPFFGNSQVFMTEQELRDDAYRWESVLRAEHRFNASTLNQPVFDVEHLARKHGQSAVRSDTVPYALIVTLGEPGNLDLYNSILRAYGGRLRALAPQIEIAIRSQ